MNSVSLVQEAEDGASLGFLSSGGANTSAAGLLASGNVVRMGDDMDMLSAQMGGAVVDYRGQLVSWGSNGVDHATTTDIERVLQNNNDDGKVSTADLHQVALEINKTGFDSTYAHYAIAVAAASGFSGTGTSANGLLASSGDGRYSDGSVAYVGGKGTEAAANGQGAVNRLFLRQRRFNATVEMASACSASRLRLQTGDARRRGRGVVARLIQKGMLDALSSHPGATS